MGIRGEFSSPLSPISTSQAAAGQSGFPPASLQQRKKPGTAQLLENMCWSRASLSYPLWTKVGKRVHAGTSSVHEGAASGPGQDKVELPGKLDTEKHSETSERKCHVTMWKTAPSVLLGWSCSSEHSLTAWTQREYEGCPGRLSWTSPTFKILGTQSLESTVSASWEPTVPASLLRTYQTIKKLIQLSLCEGLLYSAGNYSIRHPLTGGGGKCPWIPVCSLISGGIWWE